ncbi:gamma-glutamylcyclotransferase family protein [Bradyrhizobium sp. LHD-71]|uniref:gamma-glutamylcyclotransferase family protein n=1 Tax=Bradyrhizobium sp. LHD-71 TaxID=3072141 RepID=UPI0028102D22|nr:gamma-glutamylcyclotransferase family protein [Bradyrhizobium sp. LHD-71]MDQ8726967.1 gamma-glutamylcyclotransferase family protein [Bradyrhizobium sp. LHD-71]
MSTDHLFVFGTLLSGYDHPMARLLSREADLIGEASCRGRLYLVKHYPGMVISADQAEQVFGELYRLRQPRELLRTLDDYEGCGENDVRPHEFVRQHVAVAMRDRTLQAWTYLYNRPVAHLPRIASGRFLQH